MQYLQLMSITCWYLLFHQLHTQYWWNANFAEHLYIYDQQGMSNPNTLDLEFAGLPTAMLSRNKFLSCNIKVLRCEKSQYFTICSLMLSDGGWRLDHDVNIPCMPWCSEDRLSEDTYFINQITPIGFEFIQYLVASQKLSL